MVSLHLFAGTATYNWQINEATPFIPVSGFNGGINAQVGDHTLDLSITATGQTSFLNGRPVSNTTWQGYLGFNTEYGGGQIFYGQGGGQIQGGWGGNYTKPYDGSIGDGLLFGGFQTGSTGLIFNGGATLNTSVAGIPITIATGGSSGIAGGHIIYNGGYIAGTIHLGNIFGFSTDLTVTYTNKTVGSGAISGAGNAIPPGTPFPPGFHYTIGAPRSK